MASKSWQSERTQISVMDMKQACNNMTIRRRQQFSSENRFQKQQLQQSRIVLGRSVSFAGGNARFCREPLVPMLKRQSSVVARRVADTGGEFLRSCFGPVRSEQISSPDSLSSKLMVSAAEKHSSGRWEEFADQKPAVVHHHLAWFPRSRSTTSFMRSTRLAGSGNWKNLMAHGVVVEDLRLPKASNSAAAVQAKDRIARQGGHWQRQPEADDQSYKPPAPWKLLLRKLRAQAKRSVHPAPTREQWMNYDLQSYRKNFDNGAADSQAGATRSQLYAPVSAAASREKAVHAALLAKFHSARLADTNRATAPETLLRTGSTHIPVGRSAALELSNPKAPPAITIWQRSAIDAAPALKLEIR
ncbi:unnamed protein product [Sphagnum troendelagicum]|uniref:Testicular haploid expressed protein n=1 Tax=Sphagnum troendelagicum TaxID=128251 RepID=A0ABP0UX98_9BRYO